VKEKNKIAQAIQVCYEMDSKNEKREIVGLIEAMKKFELKKGLILTMNQEEEMIRDNLKIKIIPVWKWLLKK